MHQPLRRRWQNKFKHAFRGLAFALRTQDSFRVHLPMAIAVAALAWILQVPYLHGCLLVLCVGVVFAAELFNTSIEMLVRRLHPQQHHDIGIALDLAAAAVLAVAIAAAVIGVIIFVHSFLIQI